MGIRSVSTKSRRPRGGGNPAQAQAWWRAWLRAWPRAKRVATEVEAKEWLSARPWATVWTLAAAKARAATRAPALPKTRAKVALWVEALAVEVARARARAQTRELRASQEDSLSSSATERETETQGEKMARRVAEEEAFALAGVWSWARSEAQTRGDKAPSGLADFSAIRCILTSLNRSGIARDLWRCSRETRDEYSCIIHFIAPITRLPLELLHQIFLIVIDEASGPPLGLMLVCRDWHAVVTSIWASLNLGTRTPIDAVTSKLERNQWILDIVVDTDSDRGGPSGGAFEAIFAAIEASPRWRSLVVESFPAQADLPEDIVNRCLQWDSNTTMNRFTTLKVKSICETSPLLTTLLHILGTGTMASSALISVEINSPNVISFLAPAYPSLFHSVKVLSLDTPGVPNPVDLLPHLHQLESFTASHISFPTYHAGTDLPLIHTLHHLRLKAVSIQWMSGRTFYFLENCTIIFPLRHHLLHTFSATLPKCKHLKFQGTSLDILNNISAEKLTHLSVTCSSSFNRWGDQQLVWLSQVFRERQLAPKILTIGIEAASRSWVNALAFMPGLEELVIHGARPSSIGAKVFRSLVVQPVDSNNLGATSTPGRSGLLLCPLLRRFGLKYDRWLRPSEQFTLIPVFLSIIRSRHQLDASLESFNLWMRSDQKHPLALMGISGVSHNGVMRLAKESGIEGSILPFFNSQSDPSAISPENMAYL